MNDKFLGERKICHCCNIDSNWIRSEWHERRVGKRKYYFCDDCNYHMLKIIPDKSFNPQCKKCGLPYIMSETGVYCRRCDVDDRKF